VRYFGTDGIRGEAGTWLTADLALRIGQATATILGQPGDLFVLGEDPRLSSDMLAAAFAAGLMAAGCDVEPLGRIPTPGVAYVTRTHQAVAGAMISASHNPVQDNGIKLFAGDGYKLRLSQEAAIEACLADPATLRQANGYTTGHFRRRQHGDVEYRQYLRSIPAMPLTGLKVVIDCGFGSAATAAPEVLESLGANVVAINCSPDGARINIDCGSEHPEDVMRIVTGIGADLGIAYDGDADRAILVDETGAVVDGDHILCMWALERLRQGHLPGNCVVGTILTNQGLEAALAPRGARLERVDVGDKYIAWRMQELGACLGGEQSGHLIFGDHATTGDGILTSLKVAELVVKTGQRLSELAHQMEPFPQVALNVPTRDRDSWKYDAALTGSLEALSADLLQEDGGRLLVRPSGTQPLIRVMAESRTPDCANRYAEQAAAALRSWLEVQGQLA